MAKSGRRRPSSPEKKRKLLHGMSWYLGLGWMLNGKRHGSLILRVSMSNPCERFLVARRIVIVVGLKCQNNQRLENWDFIRKMGKYVENGEALDENFCRFIKKFIDWFQCVKFSRYSLGSKLGDLC